MDPYLGQEISNASHCVTCILEYNKALISFIPVTMLTVSEISGTLEVLSAFSSGLYVLTF